MNLELTKEETDALLSALSTEYARLNDLARRQTPYPNLALNALAKAGAVHDLRARVRDLTRRGTASKRTQRVGSRFGREKIQVAP